MHRDRGNVCFIDSSVCSDDCIDRGSVAVRYTSALLQANTLYVQRYVRGVKRKRLFGQEHLNSLCTKSVFFYYFPGKFEFELQKKKKSFVIRLNTRTHRRTRMFRIFRRKILNSPTSFFILFSLHCLLMLPLFNWPAVMPMLVGQ